MVDLELEDMEGRGGWQDERHAPPATTRRTGRASHAYMGVISTQSPKITKIQELISNIKPEAMRASTRPTSHPSLLTVLTTPSYAKHALSSGLPTEILERFGDNPTRSKPLDAIVAVVDRLPLPAGSLKGTEGLAYAFAPDPGRQLSSTPVPLNTSAQKPGTLSFALPPVAELTSVKPRNTVTTIQIPLAQTIFSNGLPSTLVHSHYHFDPLSGALRKSASQRLESQTLDLYVGSQPTELAASIPLIPLTPLREVQHSMGNIIQKVSLSQFPERSLESEVPNGRKAHGLARAEDEQPTLVPASQELEEAVSDYFRFVGIAPQPVQVWAVILTASARESINRRAGTDEVHKATKRLLASEEEGVRQQWASTGIERGLSSAILEVIGQGGRLCRVLSGGGGWGKKAGLLSLDPDVEYSTRDLRGETGWKFDFEGDDSFEAVQRQRREALGEIVREGDGVMFLLAPKDVQRDALAPQKSQSTPGCAVTLGVVPSSINEYASSSPSDNGHTSKIANELEHHANFFGMLSEGGLAISVTGPSDNVLTQSKMDVPFQQLSVIEKGE